MGTTRSNKSILARIRSRGAFGVALALTVFASVIWAKLRLVGGVPRTAYAVPEDDAQAGAQPEAQNQAQPNQDRSQASDQSAPARDPRDDDAHQANTVAASE